MQVSIDPLVEADQAGDPEHHTVTVLAPEIDAATLEAVTGRVAASGGNIERIVRLAAYPGAQLRADRGRRRPRAAAPCAGRGGGDP